MKIITPAFLVAAIAAIPLISLSVVEAAADGNAQSARGALKTMVHKKGAHYLGRVLMVEGRYGYHQPRVWRVLALDPQVQGRVREFMISGDQIDSERVMLAWKQGRRVPLREVSVDSSDAFLQADLAAKDAKVGFDSLDYQLIMPAEGKEPLWLVTLVGKTGYAVGEVQVGAKTGVVLRKAWPKPGTGVAQGRRDQSTQIKQPTPKTKSQPAVVQTARRPVKASGSSTRPPKPQRVASVRKPPPPRPRPAQQQRPAQPSTTVDGASIKEASGQILENARQGIIRTSGNVRDFFKGLHEK